jgi:hypothetical protein
VSVQDWCTVCAKRTIGTEIILDAPDGTPRLQGSCENLFLSIWSAQFASNVPFARISFRMQPMELLGDVGHAESHFFLFGDSVCVNAR